MLSRKMQRASVVKRSDPDHHFYIATSSRGHDAHGLGYSQVLEGLPNHRVGRVDLVGSGVDSQKV